MACMLSGAAAWADAEQDYLAEAAIAVESLERINELLGEITDATGANEAAPDVEKQAKRYALAMSRLQSLEAPSSPGHLAAYAELRRRMLSAVTGYHDTRARLQGGEKVSAALEEALANLRKRAQG